MVMLTSREIRPLRFSPVTIHVYLVSEYVVAGKDTEGLVEFQIEYGALQAIFTVVVFELQLPVLQVRVPPDPPPDIEGSDTMEGMARFRTSAERCRVAMPLAMSDS